MWITGVFTVFTRNVTFIKDFDKINPAIQFYVLENVPEEVAEE